MKNILFSSLIFVLSACSNSDQEKLDLSTEKIAKKEITTETPKNLQSNHPTVYGNWNCSGEEIGFDSVFKLEFLGQKVIVTDFTGMSRNTSYEKINGKILLETGDVLSIQDDDTIIFPMPIAQFYTTINCICTKISEE